VGERGQIVIPAEARKAYDIEVGDRILVFTRPHSQGLILLKAEEVSRIVGESIAEISDLEDLLKKVDDNLEDGEPQ
jgi:AbrB family looped-hinge helix DNA binding protein